MEQKGKRIILILACIGFVFLLPFFAHLENRELPRPEVLSVSDYEQLLSNQKETHVRNYLGHLLINGAPAPYDAGQNCYYVSESIDAKAFLAELSWSDQNIYASFAPDPLWENKAEAMKNNHPFTLIVSDGRSYHRQSVIFSGLPVLTIQTESEKSYVFDEGIPTGTLRVFEPGDDAYTVHTSLCTFHPRGNTTSKFDKTPLRICLYQANGEKNHLSLAGLRTDDDWILNSLYTDSSKIRDQVSVDLWNNIADTNPEHDIQGTHMAYVEVIIDGSYEGLFGLMEPIGKKSTGLDPERDILYQAKSFLLREEDFLAARSGLEFFAIEIKTPDYWTGETVWDPITDFVDRFSWNTDSYSYEELVEIMDLDNAIDHSLFLDATTATDNFFHNTYYLAVLQESGRYRFTKIPWDLNYTFGDRWDDNIENLFTVFDQELIESCQLSRDMRKLVQIAPETIGPKLGERWFDLRKTVLSEDAVTELILKTDARIKDSGDFFRDSLRWPEAVNDPNEAEMILDFVQDRLAYLDRYYEDLMQGGIS